MNFPNKKYSIIYADPAWSYELGNRQGDATKHYSTMKLDDMKNLPVKKISDTNSILFMWTTSPTLPEALELMKAWDFTYKTIAFVWSKTNNEMGLGHYTRTNHEFVLLGKKGTFKRKSASVKQWIKEPSSKHSKKPDIVRQKIIELCGDLPRIELFARQKAHGWDAWGNEIEEIKPLEYFSKKSMINKELLLD